MPVLAHNDLRSFWDASIAFQAERGSPFSVWGLYEGAWIDTVQRGVQIVAVPARSCWRSCRGGATSSAWRR